MSILLVLFFAAVCLMALWGYVESLDDPTTPPPDHEDED